MGDPKKKQNPKKGGSVVTESLATSRRSRSGTRTCSRNGSRTSSRVSSRSSRTSRGSTFREQSSVISPKDEKLQKYRSSVIIRNAQKRQSWLDCLYVFLSSIQALTVILVAAVGLNIHSDIPEMGNMGFYIVQFALEVVLFVVAVSSTCSPKRGLRVLLIAAYISAVLYNLIWISVHLVVEDEEQHYLCDRENAEKSDDVCVLMFFSAKHNILVLSIGLCGIHGFLSIMAILVSICFEGSMSHYRSSDRGRRFLERHVKSSGHRSRSQSSERTYQSPKKSGDQPPRVDIHLGSVPPTPGSKITQSMSQQRVGASMTGDDGETIGYGVAITDTVQVVTETPSVVSTEKVTVGKYMTTNKDGLTVVTQSPVQIEVSSRANTSTKHVAGPMEMPPTPNSLTEQKNVQPYNSITKMPPLESPISYLSRKNQKKEKKSDHIV